MGVDRWLWNLIISILHHVHSLHGIAKMQTYFIRGYLSVSTYFIIDTVFILNNFLTNPLQIITLFYETAVL